MLKNICVYIEDSNRQRMSQGGNYVFRTERLVLRRVMIHGTLCIFKTETNTNNQERRPRSLPTRTSFWLTQFLLMTLLRYVKCLWSAKQPHNFRTVGYLDSQLVASGTYTTFCTVTSTFKRTIEVASVPDIY